MALVQKSAEASVGTIMLDHQEKHNALSAELISDLLEALASIIHSGARVVILRALRGARVWSAGHDARELPTNGRDPLTYHDPLRRLVRTIQEAPVPVIAMVEGSVWGGACELVMSCDLVVAAEGATFAITPAKLGVPYDIAGVLNFMRSVSLPVIKEMLFTAQSMPAARALRVGIVNQVVPAERLEGATAELAAQMTRNSPLVIALLKEELRVLAGATPLNPGEFERIQGLRRRIYDSADYQEGIRSFFERRAPPASRGGETMTTGKGYPVLTADEAAALIPNGAMVAVGGFTPAGAPKAVPRALARHARELHQAGTPFQVRLLSGASTGAACDDELARAEAVSWRAPYITSAPMRELANTGRLEFVDMHLWHVAQSVMEGFLGPIDFAVIEATEITPDGRVYLTTGIGNVPTFLHCARKVIIELNAYHSPRLRELADILILPPPPHRHPLPIRDPLDRIGRAYAEVDPSRVIEVVHTNEPDGGRPFTQPDEASRRIAEHVAEFFLREVYSGRIPPEFLPLQSGVGNICNAVLSVLASRHDFPRFKVYTEVLQDAMLDLIASGKVIGASACALTLTPEKLKFLYDNFDDFTDRIILRPQEISNNPGVTRRLGVIAVNTAIEVDMYGHVNSTHLLGTQIVNGLGGSGDFERNAYLSVFLCPSTAKGGRISTIVPMCPHIDHSEHSVQVVVTEQGLADLRGLSPMACARRIIDSCAHPAYRDSLHCYLEGAPMGHIRHDLRRCFFMHLNYLEHGAMLPELDLAQFEQQRAAGAA